MVRRSAAYPALLAAALAAGALPPELHAQPSGAGQAQAGGDERDVARRHFQRGKELHAERKYREAAAEYLEAYSHFPSPAFIYNVAQVYRLAGDRQAALENYRRYLELDPDGEASADAREFIASIEASGTEPGEPGEPAGDRDETLLPDDEDLQPIDPIQPREPVDTGAGGSPGRGKKIAGTAIGAAGVVALGVAIGFGLSARSSADELSDYRGPWTPEQEQTYQDGKSAERAVVISAVVGGASLAAGAVLFYLGHRDSRRAAERRAGANAARPVHLGMSASDEAAILTVVGSF